MIIYAFSHVLQQEWTPAGSSSLEILHRWLVSLLSDAEPQDTIGRIIHAEFALEPVRGEMVVVARSESGECLLRNLYDYCQSYEQWQFRRWLHQANSSHFNHSMP